MKFKSFNSFYNGGFMAGRVVSAIIGSYVRPRNMIFASLCASLISSFVLVGLAAKSAYGLYIGMGVMGYVDVNLYIKYYPNIQIL